MCRFQYRGRQPWSERPRVTRRSYYKVKALPCARATTHARSQPRTICSSSAAASTVSRARTTRRAAGLRVALIEADDFGSGASFNHQKTAHGGLRSLRIGRISAARAKRFANAARSRGSRPGSSGRCPSSSAPTARVAKNRLALRAAFKLDAWLGRHRNDGVEPELHLPAPRLRLEGGDPAAVPGVRPRGAHRRRAVVRLPDGRKRSADVRVRGRRGSRGADLANYVEAVAAIKEGGRVVGMNGAGPLTGAELPIRATRHGQRGWCACRRRS